MKFSKACSKRNLSPGMSLKDQRSQDDLLGRGRRWRRLSSKEVRPLLNPVYAGRRREGMLSLDESICRL